MSNSNEFGYSQQTPTDANTDLTAVAFIVRRKIAELDIMKLVEVKAVHGGGVGNPPPTVDVQLLVNQLDGGGNTVQQEVVYGLPCWRFQAGSTAIVLDPVVGDIGYVVCSDRDISTVISSKAQGNPGSYRQCSVNDGVYVGALVGAAPTCFVFFSSDGHVKVQDTTGNVVQTSSSGISITPVGGPVVVNGDVHVTGAVIAGYGGGDQVGLQTHVHNQGVDSHGDIEQPTAAPTAGT